MKNANTHRLSAVEYSISDIPLVLNVFFWSLFRAFCAIGGDTEHERIFYWSDPLHADGIKGKTKNGIP